jgi:ribosomal-protein-alanine N-acetyltransferase
VVPDDSIRIRRATSGDAEGAGLASALHRAALDAADADGFSELRLFVAAGQARARRFYEEGWRPAGDPFDDRTPGLTMIEYRHPMAKTRLVVLEDASALAELVTLNREFLAPWDPIRPDSYFTVDGQLQTIEEALARYAEGSAVPHVIVDRGEVAGRVILSNIVRGPFQSCNLGYWVGAPHRGRALATAAVRDIMRLAFGDLHLHRIEAGTLLNNLASQRVLERNGFSRFGIAPGYLKIAGRWQDHVMYQALSTDSNW